MPPVISSRDFGRLTAFACSNAAGELGPGAHVAPMPRCAADWLPDSRHGSRDAAQWRAPDSTLLRWRRRARYRGQRSGVTCRSHPASLKAPEEAVGAPLFSCHAAGVKLTPAGIRVLRHARQIDGPGGRAPCDEPVLRVSPWLSSPFPCYLIQHELINSAPQLEPIGTETR